MTTFDNRRFARQIVLPQVGEQGQARLRAATVLIVGLGGLGSPAALYLASSGIGTMLLNDFDSVDVSNLPRQVLFRDTDVGQRKCVAAARHLTELAPEASVQVLDKRLNVDELAAAVKRADIVVDGTDNFSTRFLVNDACVAARVPLVSGAAIRLEGQVVRFANTGVGPCYRCLYNDEDDWLGDCEGNGILAPVTGVIGAMMALEVIKTLLEPALGAGGVLSLWDAESGDWSRVEIPSDANCAAPHA